MKEKWEKIKSSLHKYRKQVWILLGVLVVVLCVWASMYGKPAQTEPIKKPEVVEEVNEELEEYKKLKEQNSDFYGWLKIDGTTIDFPVVYRDNEFYLTHNFALEDDPYGIPFIEEKCDIENRSTNLLIHGHSTLSGPIERMFDDMVKYRDIEFYKENSTIQFNTLEEMAEYEIFIVLESRVMYKNEDNYRYYNFIDALDEEEFNYHMEQLKTMELYDSGVSASYGDELITLSTCDPTRENGRLVMVAKKVK